MRTFKTMAVATLLLFGAAACGDLEVPNEISPDADRALANPGDVESLISGSWFNWWYPNYHYSYTPGALLSGMSFQHAARAANFGQLYYPAIPRNPTANTPADNDYGQWSSIYTYSYRAINAANDGLSALTREENPIVLEDPVGADATSPDFNRQARAIAFARYVQGISYGRLAILFDQGPLVDETTDLSESPEFIGYQDMLQAAIGYLDQAIAIANDNEFTIPYDWMYVEQPFGSADLARVASSYKARLRAAVARTPEERAAVDWNAVVAEIDAGVTDDFNMSLDNTGFRASYTLYYTLLQTGPWSTMPYFIHGMADQSGKYQDWIALPHLEKHPDHPSVEPFIIATDDLRFPQGATIEEQMGNPGTRFHLPSNYENGWASATRGTWRWSYYRDARDPVAAALVGNTADISMVEMNMLRAEANLRGFGGDDQAAADLINITRVEAGLDPADPTLPNDGNADSCVPRLPDGSCGDLWEMMKWEKRMEAGHNLGHMIAPWYFDSRGWGDHMQGTILNWPVPALVAEQEGLEIENFGGSLEWGAPVGTYGF